MKSAQIQTGKNSIFGYFSSSDDCGVEEFLVAKAGLQNATGSSPRRTWWAITRLTLRYPCPNLNIWLNGCEI